MIKHIVIGLAILFPFSCITPKTNTLPKKQSDTLYHLYDIPVIIENGRGENITVLFTATVSVYLWKYYITKNNNSEKEAFTTMAQALSKLAKNTLKNGVSFEPLKKQFFLYVNNEVECTYVLTKSNSDGTLSETNVAVRYNPLAGKDRPAGDTIPK